MLDWKPESGKAHPDAVFEVLPREDPSAVDVSRSLGDLVLAETAEDGAKLPLCT
jgi:hypothetical protein